VGSAAVEVILRARQAAGGRFRDLGHFLDQVDLSKVNKRVIESLVKAGAFDWTGLGRAAMMAGLDDAMRVAQQAQETRASGQVSLFGGATAPLPAFRFPEAPEWPTGERLAFEREALGFFLSGHPLEPYMRDLARHVTCTLDRLPTLAPAPGAPRDFRNRAGEVVVAGMVSGLRTIRTQRGRMAFATLADPTGTADCSFFGDVWEQSREVLQSERPVLLRGRLELREGREAPTLKVESVQPLADLLATHTREVRLVLRRRDLDGAHIEALLRLLAGHPGACACTVELDFDQRATVHLRAPSGRGVSPADELRTGIEALFGRPDVVRFL
jgi:DNA polymerase-3 subunit alpha